MPVRLRKKSYRWEQHRAKDCACGQVHAAVLTCDAAAPRAAQLDPTGTLKLRRSVASDLRARWTAIRRLVAAQVGKADVLALSPLTTHAAAVQAGEDRLKAAQAWLDSSLRQHVVGYDGGSWLSRSVAAAYGMGVQRAAKQVGKLASVDFDRAALHGAAAVVELEGIAEAVSQNAMRALASALIARTLPQAAAREVGQVVQSVGELRGLMLANVSVVKAFNEGMLDALQSLGVRKVGVLPEHLAAAPQLAVRDAKPLLGDANPNQPRNRLGQFRAYARPPSTRQYARVRRAEERLGELGRVNVLTAGDDKVCPTCEDIAEGGPYLIDEARGLIPAHPSCRCAFDPVDDDEPVEVEDAFDPNQPRDPDGRWTDTGISRPRSPSEDVNEVIDAHFKYGMRVGNEEVELKDLNYGTSMGDSPSRVAELAEKIKSDEGYFSRPIVDDEGNVLEGQHRVSAAELLGAKKIPVYRVQDLGRGFPVDEMETVAKGFSVVGHPDRVRQLVRNALKMIHESGSAEKALEEYEHPPGYEAAYIAVLNVAKRKKP